MGSRRRAGRITVMGPVLAAGLLSASVLFAGGCRERVPETLTLTTPQGALAMPVLKEHLGPGDARIVCRVADANAWREGMLVLRYSAGDGAREAVLRPLDAAEAAALQASMPPSGGGVDGAARWWGASIPNLGRGQSTEYALRVRTDGAERTLPADAPLRLTFKGSVSRPMLLAHVLFMMGGLVVLLLGFVVAIAHLRSGRGLATMRRLALAGFVCLVIGGVPLGIVVEYQVFGTYWEGWPFGRDVTDTKTGLLLVLWLVLMVVRGRDLLRRTPAERAPSDRAWARWVIALVALTVALYLIPHENIKF